VPSFAVVRRVFSWLLLVGALGCTSEQQMASLGDLALENGQTIRDCRIGYRTFGTLNADRSNAVLLPTWAMGTSRELAGQIGPGKLVDSSRYFVIAVDTLGNGVSSSPSNSSLQSGDAFPDFSLADVVEAEYELVTRVLGLRRLKAVVGISLGGIQAFGWATIHPELMDKVVSIVGTPRSSSDDRRRWQDAINDIRSTPGWMRAMKSVKNGAPLGAFDQLVNDGNDFVRQARLMIGVDVSARFDGSMERAAAALRAPLRVVVSPTDNVVDPAAAREFAQLAAAELIELDGRCGHMATSCDKETLITAVARFLERPSKAAF
jgi:homoserine O-acetyltransferase/O-succinyltransferase